MHDGERRRRRIRGSRGGTDQPPAAPVAGPLAGDSTDDDVDGGATRHGAVILEVSDPGAPHPGPPHPGPPRSVAHVGDQRVAGGLVGKPTSVGSVATPRAAPHDRRVPHDDSPPHVSRPRPMDHGPHAHPVDMDSHRHQPIHDDRDSERGLRGLIGGGSSQVSVTAAMRARDAARPTDADIAHAEATLNIVHRGWVPRDQP